MCVCPRSWTPDIELDDATIGQQAPYVVMLPDSEFQVSHDHMCVRCHTKAVPCTSNKRDVWVHEIQRLHLSWNLMNCLTHTCNSQFHATSAAIQHTNSSLSQQEHCTRVACLHVCLTQTSHLKYTDHWGKQNRTMTVCTLSAASLDLVQFESLPPARTSRGQPEKLYMPGCGKP